MSLPAPDNSSPSSPSDTHRADVDDTIAIGRPVIAHADIQAALDGCQTWAMITDDTVNLAEIRRRVHAAGLDRHPRSHGDSVIRSLK
jgi:hypothetical protein